MTKNNTVDILGIRVNKLTIVEANNSIAELVNNPPKKRSAIVVKPYVEFLTAAQKDPLIKNILNTSDLCIADGVSLQWAASFLYGEPGQKFLKVPRSGLRWLQKSDWRNQVLPEKMAGVTQTKALLKLAEEKGWRIGIIGGINSPEEIHRAVAKNFPKLAYLKTWKGFFEPEEIAQHKEADVIKEIVAAKLDVLFVAMGFPRQERFMYRNREHKLAKVMIGEGGTFDYSEMGGPIRRAPVWMQKSGTEWFWRLMRQPKRIARQTAIPKFVWLVKKQSKHQ
ncbi:MAG: WecB/TagA/CpsF family glycosyltransferase [Candidatus Saccharibacteria bacterium]